jgi:DNA-directed RNA polymerase specialized sigma24 family protein
MIGHLPPTLSHELLQALLAHLDPSPERAGALYNRHRQRLVQYFTWERAFDPETLADDVIDRVARRLHEGEVIPRVGAYFLGVARLVALEERRRAEQTGARLREYSRQVRRQAPAGAGETQLALSCLDRCLARLSPDRRALILEYYGGDPRTRIAARQRLAERFGVQPGALRNRALRLRENLERCVAECRARAWHRDGKTRLHTDTQSHREPQDGDDE